MRVAVDDARAASSRVGAASSNGSSSSSKSTGTASRVRARPARPWMRCCASHAPSRTPPSTPPRRRASPRTPSTPSRRATAPIRPGSARAALRHDHLPPGVHRRLPVEHRQLDAERRPRRPGLRPHPAPPAFVGVLLFAQLGPLLLFSLVGGLLADAFDRRRLLVTVSVLQGLLSLALAWVARVDDPSKVGARRRSCSSSAWARPCSARPTARCCRRSSAGRTCRAPSRSTRRR